LDVAVPDGPPKEVLVRLYAMGMIAADHLVPSLHAKIAAASVVSPDAQATVVDDGGVVCARAKSITQCLVLSNCLSPSAQADPLAVYGAVKLVLQGKLFDTVSSGKSKGKVKVKPSIPQATDFNAIPPAWAKVVGQSLVGGEVVEVTLLDMVSSQVRNTIAQVLKEIAPDVYAQYREVKDACDGSLAARKTAYKILFDAFLDRTYRLAGV
jgi:hypothetical protein